jgi:hypothetical protein
MVNMYACNATVQRGLTIAMRGVKAIMTYIIAPDYIVTGDLIPDATGNYFYGGELNEHPYYHREDNEWYIYFDIPYWCWILTSILGTVVDLGWIKWDEEIEGYYYSDYAEGLAYVSEA